MGAKVIERREIAPQPPQMVVAGAETTTSGATEPLAYIDVLLGDYEESYGKRPVVDEYQKEEWPYEPEDGYDEE